MSRGIPNKASPMWTVYLSKCNLNKFVQQIRECFRLLFLSRLRSWYNCDVLSMIIQNELKWLLERLNLFAQILIIRILPSHIPRDLTASLLRPCYEEPKDAQGRRPSATILNMHKTVSETLRSCWVLVRKRTEHKNAEPRTVCERNFEIWKKTNDFRKKNAILLVFRSQLGRGLCVRADYN
jgi:hypothetical protein